MPGSILDGDGSAARHERSPRQAGEAAQRLQSLPLPVGVHAGRSPIHRKRNESRGHMPTHYPSPTSRPRAGPMNDAAAAARAGRPPALRAPARPAWPRSSATPSCRHAAHASSARARQSGRPARPPKGGGARGRGDRRSYWPLSLAPRACAKDLAGAYKILLQAVDSTGRDGIRRMKGELALPVSGVHASFFDRNRRR